MKQILIIGGGVAGLSAGIFAQKNGFSSKIIEKNPEIGGECTGWDRKGYHIDGCMHWLPGTLEGSPLNRLWKSVGALDGVAIYQPESFLVYEHEGTTACIYRDLERLRDSWIEISPEDTPQIEELCRDIRSLQAFDMPVDTPMDLLPLLEKIKVMLSMKEAGAIMSKYGKVSSRDFAKRFSHPALRGIWEFFLPEGYSAAFLFFALASFTKGDAALPAGGSRAFTQRMAKRYESLGGVIEHSCEIIQADIKGKRVAKLTAQDGRAFAGDYVVTACDAHWVLYDLLQGSYPVRAFGKRFANPKVYPIASQIQVSLGVAAPMDHISRSLCISATPFTAGTQTIDKILINHFAHEPGFAPEGHTCVRGEINQFEKDIDQWFALSQDKQAYRAEKQRVGRAVIAAVEARFPELKGLITLLDVTTPKTYHRYTNAYRGAITAFQQTTGSKMMSHTGKVRGLSNLYMSGQWLQPPGGLPGALITGKDTIQRICKREKKSFTI